MQMTCRSRVEQTHEMTAPDKHAGTGHAESDERSGPAMLFTGV